MKNGMSILIMIGYGFKEGVERVQRETDLFFEALGYRHEKKMATMNLFLPLKKKSLSLRMPDLDKYL